jgi:hypothetical protein
MRRTFPIVALVAVIATSCGRGTGSSDGISFVSAAAERSLAAKSVKVTMTMTGTPPTAEAPAMTGEGVIDLAHNRSRLSMNVPASVGSGAQQDTSIYDNGTIYSSIPAELKKEIGTKAKWIKIVLPAGAADSGIFGGGSFASLVDPKALLNSLRDVSKSVTVVGHPVIRGIKTTEYSASLDVSKAFPANHEASPSPTDSNDTGFAQDDVMLLRAATATVFIGNDGLVYRIGEEMSLATLKLSGVIDFSDYGLPVDIKIPPASEVIDEKQMADLFEKNNSSSSGSTFDPSGIYGCVDINSQDSPDIPTCTPSPR